MGIQNLLRFMKPFIHPVHIKKYAGKRLGIDAYSWLHKGAYSCSLELCQNSDSEKKSRYLQYFMHRIELLRHHKVVPVVVFDGGNIPCKADTEGERGNKREANLVLAREQLKNGNTSVAIEFFQRAVSVTPSMAHELIQILKSNKVEFIVAPYEADAQLAYLSSLDAKQERIDAVITEDSDLMAYGCPSVIFKMDRYGNGEEFVLDEVFNSVSSIHKKKDSTAFLPSFQNFNKELFTGMCVLAGCDFLAQIPGIGIRRAYNLVSKYKNLDRVLSVLKIEKGKTIPEDYAKSFKKAVAVFHHARVFDARTKTIKPMKPLPEEFLNYLDGDLDFLGPELPSSIAIAIAHGRLDPITMEAFDHFPKVESNLDLIKKKPVHFEKIEIEMHEVAAKESCFTLFSSCQSREAKTKVQEQKPTVDERKYLNEVCALQKLVVPREVPPKSINVVEKRVYADNNPFKKRKLDEVPLDQEKSITTQASVVTSDDILNEIVCMTPASRNGEKCKKVDEVSDSGSSDQNLRITPKSQDSVNSKPTKKNVTLKKEILRNGNNLKRKSSCKTPGDSRSSILNFFTRL